LTVGELRMNMTIGREQVIMAYRWAQREDLYPIIFEIYSAVINFDIRLRGAAPCGQPRR
jgi:hypothetical protein